MGAKLPLNTPRRQYLGRKLGGWAKERRQGSRGKSKEGQGTPLFCFGDCLGLLTLRHILCPQQGH